MLLEQCKEACKRNENNYCGLSNRSEFEQGERKVCKNRVNFDVNKREEEGKKKVSRGPRFPLSVSGKKVYFMEGRSVSFFYVE